MVALLRRLILRRIEKKGRNMGAPTIKFDDKSIITVEDEYLSAGETWLRQFTGANAFYLTLPSNAYGVVTYPDGTTRSMPGGLHPVPPGLYKLKYVDRLERFAFTASISEASRDGEKITLKVLIRYRVVDPLAVMNIDSPVEALIEHVQTDIAQYIRTHDHNEIADSADMRGESRIFSFFADRHGIRHPLSDAISITGVELKEFIGDKEHVDMRHGELLKQRQEQIDRERLDRQKDFEKMQAEHKAAMDKLHAQHKAEIDKTVTQAAAEKEALRSEILYESKIRDVQIENLRTQSQRRHELVVKAVDAIGQALEPSGYSRNSTEVKGVIDELLAAIKEDNPDMNATQETSKDKKAGGVNARTSNNEKIEALTNTLLKLSNSKK